jgi:hypothetical protein
MQNKRHKKPFQFNKTQNTNETKQTKKLSQQRPLTKRQTSPYTVAKSLKLCRQKLSKKKVEKKGSAIVVLTGNRTHGPSHAKQVR